MRLKAWATAALVLSLSWTGRAATAQVENGREYQTAGTPAEFEDALSSYNSYETYGSDGCSSGGYNSCSTGRGMLGGVMDRPLQLIAGAEYIYARANFSQALSYVNIDPGTASTYHQYDFDYNSSYGLYGGIADCCCGGAIMFNFQRLRSDSDFGDQTGTNTFVPFETNPGANGVVNGSASVDLKSYGLTFQKTIPLGSPLCGTDSCGCGDTCTGDVCCADPCGNWCPAWDITWSGGVRFADASWTSGANSFQPNPSPPGQLLPDRTYRTTMDFNGFGLQTGLLGRRYIGRKGRFSIFAKGNVSLLAGDYNIRTTVTQGLSATPSQSTISDQSRLIVPVTEIRAGGTYHMGNHASISGGYFLAAWHDLGMRGEYDFNGTPGQLQSYDDANILGFEGFFVRGQVNF